MNGRKAFAVAKMGDALQKLNEEREMVIGGWRGQRSGVAGGSETGESVRKA